MSKSFEAVRDNEVKNLFHVNAPACKYRLVVYPTLGIYVERLSKGWIDGKKFDAVFGDIAGAISTIKQDHESQLQSAVGKLVEREVISCVSTLVHTLATNHGTATGELGELCEQAVSLSDAQDYEQAARDYVDGINDLDELKELCQGIDLDVDDYGRVSNVRDALLEEIGAYDNWQSFCDDQNIEPHALEIYEHWQVSNWLAGQLQEMGYPVDGDFAGLTVWGRATTGQAIHMDDCMKEIYLRLQG